MPARRFEDIYFGDHYNYILFLFFVALCTTSQTGKNFGIDGVCETATIHDMSVFDSDPEEGGFLYFAL